MNYIGIIKSILTNEKKRFFYFNKIGFYKNLSDEKFVKKAFKAYMGKELDLDNPKTFNEKLQWLKLYDRKDIYTTMVDKYEVKKYVTDRIGAQYVIPTLGVWDRFEDIDFDKLPDNFVLKTTHDSGGVVICKNKKEFDIDKARNAFNKSLDRYYYKVWREWPYKNVKRRIIAEQYMEDSKTKELRDYKFFAFNGKVKAMFIASDRFSANETKFDFFDENFNHLPFTNGHPNADVLPEKPLCFDKMKELASVLSEDIPEARIDFYEVDGKVYFGEITFFHWSGFTPFNPEEWDEKFGSWIELPKK